MDSFIRMNTSESDPEHFFCVFVDSLQESYEEVSTIPTQNPSSLTTPFRDKTPQQCYELLVELVKHTESDVQYAYFAIVDERSLLDATIILACGRHFVEEEEYREDDEVVFVRARIQDTNMRLLNYVAGKYDVWEDRDRAEQEPDQVLPGV